MEALGNGKKSFFLDPLNYNHNMQQERSHALQFLHEISPLTVQHKVANYIHEMPTASKKI